ncbi:ATP-binding protein [Chloroflexota bacterium]
MLNQLGIGWPSLSESGKAIGRELIDTTINVKEDILNRILSQFAPRVVTLFLRVSEKSSDVYSLRITEEPRYFNTLSWISSLAQLMEHEKLHPQIVRLADELSDQGLAVTYSAKAYRGAKWVAKFIYFPVAVAHSISKYLAQKQSGLELPEQLLSYYSLFRVSPVPSLRDFANAGVTKQGVERFVASAVKEGAITNIVESGPAFLVLDQKAYEQLALWPLFDFMINAFFEETPKKTSNDLTGSTESAKKAVDRKTDEERSSSLSNSPVIIGADSIPNQWGILGTSQNRGVKLDLNAPHVVFVCGKMGYGKGYTIGVISEMLAGPTVPNLTLVQKPATIIVLYKPREDLPSEFWTIARANYNPKEVRVLKETYGQEPKAMVDIGKMRVFVDPFVYEKNRSHFEQQYEGATVKPLYADPSSLGGQEWSIVLSAGGRTDQLYVKRLFAILERLQFEPFDLERLLAEVINDSIMDSRQKNLAQQRINVLRNYLAGPAAQDFVRNLAVGGVNIFDFRKTIRTTDDVFSLMTLIISILQTKKGLEEEPFVFVINEAHDYFKGGVSADFVESIEHLIRRKRHGRNWLLLDTHFPDDVDDRVIQLADLKFVHYLDKATTSTVLNRAFGKHVSDFSDLPIGEALVEADMSSDGLSKVFQVSIRPRLTMHGGATKTAVTG